MIPFAASSLRARLISLGILLCCCLYFSYSFVAAPTYRNSAPAQLPLLESSRYVQVVDHKNATWPYRVYKTADWRHPHLEIESNGGELADGYLMFTPKRRGASNRGLNQSTPVIMSQDNELVYAFAETKTTNNFQPLTIDGTTHLSLWQGDAVIGHGYGSLLVMNDGYNVRQHDLHESLNTLATETKHYDYSGAIDFHEHTVTDRGTLLVTAYNNTPADLRALDGPEDGWVSDSQFYEIDLETDAVLFRWSSLDHFDFTQSKMRFPSYMCDGSPLKPWDYFHINSVQAIGDDAYLISSRHLWTCYLISRADGHVIWEFNGSGNGGDFGPLPLEGQFEWQHHARAHSISEHGMVLSLLDNHNTDQDYGKESSKAIIFQLTFPPDRNTPPTILQRLPTEYVSMSQGSYEIGLSNGNELIGFGPIPVIREYGPGGNATDIRWQGRYGNDNIVQSYRVFKAEWHATPQNWDPVLVVEGSDTNIKGYVSWNGATEVERWNVYIVREGDSKETVGYAVKDGFETMFDVPNTLKDAWCLVVAAVQGGQEVRQSNMACFGEPQPDDSGSK